MDFSLVCSPHFGWKSFNGKDHLEEHDVDWRIILELILGKKAVRIWIAFIWLMVAASGGLS